MTTSSFVEVPGGRLYCEIDGSGPPVLLIHGGLGSLRMWDEQLPVLADRFTTIRYDNRGYGRSETDDVEFSNRADAVAVLAHANVDSAAVVGQSRGGIIALDLVLERPTAARALVLVAAGASGLEPELPADADRPPWDEMERLWEAHDWARLAEMETRTWVDGWGQPADRVPAAVRERVHGWILENYRAEKAEGRPQPLDPPAAGRLAEVSAPTLVVCGTADEPGALASSRAVAAGIPRAQLVELEGVAHMLHLEQPQRFNQLLLDFLLRVAR